MNDVERIVKRISFMDFFEKSKTEPKLQRLVSEVFRTAIMTGATAKRLRPDGPEVDLGLVALDTLAYLAKREDIILTGKEEITSEYIGTLINSYGA